MNDLDRENRIVLSALAGTFGLSVFFLSTYSFWQNLLTSTFLICLSLAGFLGLSSKTPQWLPRVLGWAGLALGVITVLIWPRSTDTREFLITVVIIASIGYGIWLLVKKSKKP